MLTKKMLALSGLSTLMLTIIATAAEPPLVKPTKQQLAAATSQMKTLKMGVDKTFINPPGVEIPEFYAQNTCTDMDLNKLPDQPFHFGLRLGIEHTDKGLKGASRLRHLVELDAGMVPITDAGLTELKELPNLQSLRLDRTKITNNGFKTLGEIKTLSSLSLKSLAFDAKGLKSLSGLKSLARLDLGDTKVSDADLSELAPLTSLFEISLNSTEISDKGLMALAPLTKLREVSVARTKVTKAGAANLMKVLPNCKVTGLDSGN